jgi:hypothetical protein
VSRHLHRFNILCERLKGVADVKGITEEAP